MDIKDEILNYQKVILDMLESLEGHLKPKAMNVVANDARYIIVGLGGALKKYKKVKSEWRLSEKLALVLEKLDESYSALIEEFNSYEQKWMIIESIEKSPEEFVGKSKTILTATYKYLNQEKEQLLTVL